MGTSSIYLLMLLSMNLLSIQQALDLRNTIGPLHLVDVVLVIVMLFFWNYRF